MKKLSIKGIKVHNLKNIDVAVPLGEVTVVTGLSGSGKSSLIFDTIYAESSRRFMESLSTYSRTHMVKLPTPDIESAENIPPAIAIRFVPVSLSSRSTVGTSTEVYDFLRLLYTHLGVVWCPKCKVALEAVSPDVVAGRVLDSHEGEPVIITYPLAVNPGTLNEDVSRLLYSGFFRALNLSKEIKPIEEVAGDAAGKGMEVIHIITDRTTVETGNRGRLAESVELAYRQGGGVCTLFFAGGHIERFTEKAVCVDCGSEYPTPMPSLFSFNNPNGACSRCRGFGNLITYSIDKTIPDKSKSIREGAIELLDLNRFRSIKAVFLDTLKERGVPLEMPIAMLSKRHQSLIWQGDDRFGGILSLFERLERKRYRVDVRTILSRYRIFKKCPACRGKRLNKAALNVKIEGKDIGFMSGQSLSNLYRFLKGLQSDNGNNKAVLEILEQAIRRLSMLIDAGVGYLQLNRLTRTLSGGELQRINLVNAVGARLTGTLYLMDEPSIGLHPVDEEGLKRIISNLKDSGNTVVIAEHSASMISLADNVIELGPEAGEKGGEIVFDGSIKDFRERADTLTSNYFNRRIIQEVPDFRRLPENGFIRIMGAREHNLKNVNVSIPLNLFTCVVGPSGAGKSTLLLDVLHQQWLCDRRGETRLNPPLSKSVEGLGSLKDMTLIEGGRIARSSRSCVATYIDIFSEIRALFARLSASRHAGLAAADFSFNTRAGRCPTCMGSGYLTVDMQFMPEVRVTCDTCRGLRFKPEPLKPRYRGLNISDVLHLTATEGMEHFAEQEKILRKLRLLDEINLGYLWLGQPLEALSSGEAARLKLARIVSRGAMKNRLFLFDEPSLGLHPHNIRKLLRIFTRLIVNGATVVCIDHNLDIIKSCDYVLEFGPSGGNRGGRLIAEGTPEQIAENPKSVTGRYLKKVLDSDRPSDGGDYRSYSDWSVAG